MCRIERYNIIFPDNHIEEREQLLNTCPRGTPSNPCRRCEYVTLHNYREATQEDIEERARRLAPEIVPSRPPSPDRELRPREESTGSLARRKKHRGVLSGLSIGFKSWSPFSSGSSKKRRGMAAGKKPTIERTSRREGGITLVERPPRAPTPPPVRRVPGIEPKLVEIVPKTHRHGSGERDKKHKKDRRKPRKQVVVIHQNKRSDDSSDESSSSEDDPPSSPEPTRTHRRPKGPRSPSPASRAVAEKAARYEKDKAAREKDRADRFERIANAEHTARIRAEQDHDNEIRRERRRTIEAEQERLRLESEDQQRRRQEQEEWERHATASSAQRRQWQEDAERLRPPHAPNPPRHPVAIHQRTSSFAQSGSDFQDSALQAAIRRRDLERSDSDAGRPQSEALRRRRTVDGTHGRPHDGRNRGGHERGRYGGSR